jgi:hypothetical protein
MNDEDDIGPVSDEERAEAEALRKALDGDGDPAPGSDAAFAAAVRASMSGAKPALGEDERDEAVRAAIRDGSRRARRRSVRTLFAMAAAAIVAIAVPTAIYAGRTSGVETSSATSEGLQYGGATDSVFGAPFDPAQRASERMDRIVDARTDDYFAALRGEQR